MLRIRDVYPGSRILIFNHPESRIQKQQQKRGVNKICCHTFFCGHKFNNIENYFIFEMLKEKIWAKFQRIIELFTQKVVTKLSKILVWDPGSEIRDSEKNLFWIPDPGVKKRPYPGSGSATLVTLNIGKCFRRLIHSNGRFRYQYFEKLTDPPNVGTVPYRTGHSFYTVLNKNTIKSTAQPLLEPTTCSCANNFHETFVTFEYSDRQLLLQNGFWIPIPIKIRCKNSNTAKTGY